MLRKAASKVAWVGRTASMVFGLALVVGLVFGVATMALGANGSNFVLGQVNNTATALTKLTANVQGPAMQVQNTNPGTDDAAMALSVQPGEAPMRVNSTGKVANLNADRLDGRDASEIGLQHWAVVNADGNVRRHNGAVPAFTRRIGVGEYLVGFDDFVSDCAYAATTTDGFALQTGVKPGAFTTDVVVNVVDSSGTRFDAPFSVIVTC